MYPGDFARTTPDKAAIIMAATGAVTTYADLDEKANRLSHVLYDAGLRPGDHVALCLENHEEFFPIMWGAHYLGLYYTALSSRLTTEEMAYIINDCGAKAFITSAYKADQAAELRDQMPEISLRLMIDTELEGYDSYETAVAAASPEPLPDRTEGNDMLYSSGTTGRPKGVKVPRSETPLGEVDDAVTFLCMMLFGANADTMYLSPAPLYHAAPLRYCRSVQRLGGTVVVMDKFDPEAYLRLVEQYRITFSQIVPTMLIRMLKLPAQVRERYDVSSLNCMVHAAAPMPVAAKNRVSSGSAPSSTSTTPARRATDSSTRTPRTGWPIAARSERRWWARSTSSATTAKRSRPANRARSTSSPRRCSSTTTTRPRRLTHVIPRVEAGPPSAMSAGSTRTGFCISPTARRT